MELQERKKTKLKETSPSKLKVAGVLLKESENFFENVNALNMTQEEEEKRSASSMTTASFLTPRQQRKWKHLSEKRKQRYIPKTQRIQNDSFTEKSTNVMIKDKTIQSNVQAQTTQVGEKVVKDSVVKSAATGAKSIATGGGLQAVEMAKKTAERFKESFVRREEVNHRQFQKIKEMQREERKGTSHSFVNTAAIIFGTMAQGVSIITTSIISSVLTVCTPIILFGLILVAVISVICGFLGSVDTGIGSRAIVEAAYVELEMAEHNIGGEKYKEWYGLDGDWCAMFVAWCGNECGFIENGTMVKSASVRESKNWYEDKNLYQAKESGYVPKEGDLVFFLNDMSHIGIVVSYDSSTDQITVIEGNSGSSSTTPYHAGSRVTENVYQRTTRTISGYATPDYPVSEAQEEEENLLIGEEAA